MFQINKRTNLWYLLAFYNIFLYIFSISIILIKLQFLNKDNISNSWYNVLFINEEGSFNIIPPSIISELTFLFWSFLDKDCLAEKLLLYCYWMSVNKICIDLFTFTVYSNQITWQMVQFIHYCNTYSKSLELTGAVSLLLPPAWSVTLRGLSGPVLGTGGGDLDCLTADDGGITKFPLLLNSRDLDEI